MQPRPPYLSVVAAARNDDHGANFLGRLRTFINALVGQAARHSLPTELVLVEWNPPPGKPPLAEVIQWPHDSAPCRIRIITVPPDLHRRYRFPDALPLYQMIAKNVGIRRAEGEFILATNVDILLSDELMEFLAARRLEPGRMYRIDRHDVASDVPPNGSLDEQLAYCRSHLIRVNAREGTFALTPEGYRAAGTVDIPGAGREVHLGTGWYAPEQFFGQVFRWIADVAEVAVTPSSAARTIAFEVEPGPGVNFAGFQLNLMDSSGNMLAQARVEGPSLVKFCIPAGLKTFQLHVAGGGRRSLPDARTLNARVLRVERTAEGACSGASATPLGLRAGRRALQIAKAGVGFLRERGNQNQPRRIGLPVPSAVLKRLQIRAEARGLSIDAGRQNTDRQTARIAPADLHTNACGDFTLAHRRHWMELRGYPELDLYSMNIDSLFCYMAHYGGATEQVLSEPMRIYHIEHASGSGWTPEGQRLLFERLSQKGIPWLDFQEVLSCASLMAELRTTMIFNRDDWGLQSYDLIEVTPGSRVPPARV